MDPSETGWKGAKQIHPSHDNDHQPVVMNRVMNLWFPSNNETLLASAGMLSTELIRPNQP